MLHPTTSAPDILSTARRPVNGSIYGSTRFRVEPPDARRLRWAVPRPRPPNFLRTASVGVKPGGRAWVRGLRREGRGQRVRGRADETVAEGEAEGLDGRGRRLAAAVRHSLILRTAGCGRLPAVRLLTELDAFFIEHRRCGELDAGVDGLIVWIACECGRAWRGGCRRATHFASND
jgi:hypothetical protein